MHTRPGPGSPWRGALSWCLLVGLEDGSRQPLDMDVPQICWLCCRSLLSAVCPPYLWWLHCSASRMPACEQLFDMRGIHTHAITVAVSTWHLGCPTAPQRPQDNPKAIGHPPSRAVVQQKACLAHASYPHSTCRQLCTCNYLTTTASVLNCTYARKHINTLLPVRMVAHCVMLHSGHTTSYLQCSIPSVQYLSPNPPSLRAVLPHSVCTSCTPNVLAPSSSTSPAFLLPWPTSPGHPSRAPLQGTPVPPPTPHLHASFLPSSAFSSFKGGRPRTPSHTPADPAPSDQLQRQVVSVRQQASNKPSFTESVVTYRQSSTCHVARTSTFQGTSEPLKLARGLQVGHTTPPCSLFVPLATAFCKCVQVCCMLTPNIVSCLI
jgi:hypothetical protein